MTEEKIRAAIKVECDRQHVGEDRQTFLKYAWDEIVWDTSISFHVARLVTIAHMLEPSNGGHFRTTPVTFRGIEGGVSPDLIPRTMENWIEWFNSTLKNENRADADLIIKEFLDIHPFIDGNGRTAWLLRVWLLNQWDDPQPLPDYYYEG